jgi:hypothetical protein
MKPAVNSIEARQAVIGRWYYQGNSNMDLERKPGLQKGFPLKLEDIIWATGNVH